MAGLAFAPVVPPGAEQALPANLNAHFAFANVAWANPAYAEWYRGHKGLVVDCPIYEGKQPLTPQQLAEVSLFLEPRFLIIPDVRFSSHATLARAEEYLKILPKHQRNTGVLQGASTRGVRECCIALLDMGLVSVAVPKDLQPTLGLSRSALLSHLVQEGVLPPSVQIHLLGANWPYSDERTAGAELPMVLSVDTAEPANAALAGLRLDTCAPPARPEDWFGRANDLLTARGQRLLIGNIEVLRQRIGDHHE